MSIIQHTAPEPTAIATELPTSPLTSIQRAIAGRVDRIRSRFVDTSWEILHVLGAHRWSEGYDVDPERGMTRYRGSRCSICDSPWEGW